MYYVRTRTFTAFNSSLLFKQSRIFVLSLNRPSVSITPSFHPFSSQRNYTADMPSAKKTAPYGTWSSPITTEIVSGSTLTFSEVHTNVGNPAFSSDKPLTDISLPTERFIWLKDDLLKREEPPLLKSTAQKALILYQKSTVLERRSMSMAEVRYRPRVQKEASSSTMVLLMESSFDRHLEKSRKF